jgi:CRP-like cAMP-binding protein
MFTPQSGNLLLAAVPPEEFELIKGFFEPCQLRMRESLQEAGDEPDKIYFPTRGIVSVLTVLENGMMIEFATVGREGSTGVPFIHELRTSPTTLISQMPGEAWCIRTRDFETALKLSPGLAAAMNVYGGVLFALLAQSAACNRAHHVDERCARWLLMTHDQAGGDDFPITQEFLAQMLGVSRPSVAVSAGALQKAGLIQYHRGEVTVIDRAGLEVASCECYRVIALQFDRLREMRQY